MRHPIELIRRQLLSRSAVDKTTKRINGRHCRIWQRGRTTYGYGQLWDGEVLQYAHRLSFEIFKGYPVPEGMGALHRCDNPACIEERHLFAGTKGDNNRDRHAKGRSRPAITQVRGSKHPLAKL